MFLQCYQNYFGWQLYGSAILKISMTAITNWSSVVITVLIEYLDPENMGIDTRITHFRDQDIGKNSFLSGGHFEIQDGCHNLMIQWCYHCSYWVPWPWKHGYRHHNLASMRFRDRDMGKSWNSGGHFEIQDGCHTLMIWYCSHWIPWPWKHGYRHQNHDSSSLRERDIGKSSF